MLLFSPLFLSSPIYHPSLILVSSELGFVVEASDLLLLSLYNWFHNKKKDIISTILFDFPLKIFILFGGLLE